MTKKLIKGVDFTGIGVGTIVQRDDGKILMSQRGNKSRGDVGTWEFPGGGVKCKEEMEKGALREVYEETGIKCKNIEPLHFIETTFESGNNHWIGITFIAEYESGEIFIREEERGRVSNVNWFTLIEADKLLLNETSKENLKLYKKYIKGEKRPKFIKIKYNR